MEARPSQPAPARVDWEAFYRDYRKPGYLAGFEIVGKLGGGAFGLVFKARKESIGKDYAVKFLKVDDESVRDAVLREIDNVALFAQVDHPNLVSIEDRGVVDGIPYVVMGYAGQETLQTRLQAGPLARAEALRWFAQAARGVQALHDHGLVHFDVKPANVFVKGDVARVGDYGLSKLVSESRNSLSFSRGTPYYMAPELLQRRGDARSDVYSLGVLLYELLYGVVPFRGDSEWEVLRKHETAAVDFPPQAEPADRALIARCLQKRPEARFANAGEVVRALGAPGALGESVAFAARPAAPTVGVGATAAAAAASARDPADSPYGMPWRREEPTPALQWFARGVFAVVEFLVTTVLTPTRFVVTVGGRGLLWLLGLPFRVLGVAAHLVGLLVALGLVVLAAVALYRAFAA
ncbi:MAG: serine/threonine protein kinase [Planctomycetes bacterium]|nr:serine/threonine protein kinase [Planctomycetota bacterium]